jgi:hypothetical protein
VQHMSEVHHDCQKYNTKVHGQNIKLNHQGQNAMRIF